MKKVEKYVNSLAPPEQTEQRSVTPVFEEEDGLKPDDYIRKRIEILSQNMSKDLIQGEEEIIVLDLQTQDDHIEAAMERRQALLRMREEKKSSLKLEGIVEESPQTSPKRSTTLPTPEDYENYLDPDVTLDYPELACTPSSIFASPDSETTLDRVLESHDIPNVYPYYFKDDAAQINERLNRNSESDSPQDEQQTISMSTKSPKADKSEIMLCNTKVRSLSDSDDYCRSNNEKFTHESLQHMKSLESSNYNQSDGGYSSTTFTSGYSHKTRRSISCTSGYSSGSFDSPCSGSKKRATLFLPSSTAISMPEISLQPPTPQAPKPKTTGEKQKIKYDLHVPGFRSMFLTVPGADDLVEKSLPKVSQSVGADLSESTSSSSDDEDSIHKPRALSGLQMMMANRNCGLRKYDSSCNISSMGLNFSRNDEDEDKTISGNQNVEIENENSCSNVNLMGQNEFDGIKDRDSVKIKLVSESPSPENTEHNANKVTFYKSKRLIAEKVALFESPEASSIYNNNTPSQSKTELFEKSDNTSTKSSPKPKRKPLRINPAIFFQDRKKSLQKFSFLPHSSLDNFENQNVEINSNNNNDSSHKRNSAFNTSTTHQLQENQRTSTECSKSNERHYFETSTSNFRSSRFSEPSPAELSELSNTVRFPNSGSLYQCVPRIDLGSSTDSGTAEVFDEEDMTSLHFQYESGSFSQVR